MSYVRIYPSKNNTLFKNTAGGKILKDGNVNTGMNPIFELRDGNSNSIIVMQFDLASIKSLLKNYNYTCNLKLFDAGRITDPLLKDLKPINIFYFKEDFVEGDGWSFAANKAIEGVSNWNNRNTTDDWTGIFDTSIFSFQLNHVSDDILIPDLQTQIADAITNDVNPNFALQLESNTIAQEIYTKFLYSRYTRTIYQPYLEFYIDDLISDDRENVYATISQKLHIVNLRKEDFVGIVTCKVVKPNGTIIAEPVITNVGGGVYNFEITFDNNLSGTIVYDVWYIDGVAIRKNLIKVKSPNLTTYDYDLANLYFYPATYYQHPIIPKGDKVRFNVVSEFRTRGAFISKNYEFKVVCSNGFEMQPWIKCNVYDNKVYFIIDTSYLYEELEYEVFIRLNIEDRIQTSPQSYKFRVIYNGPTHLANVAASPYDSRNIYLIRNSNP